MHIVAGARTADLLANLYRTAPDSDGYVKAEVVRDLATDLGGQLGALTDSLESQPGPPVRLDCLVEAALACADLATLAVCNLEDLSPEGTREASRAARDAASAVRDLSAEIEAGAARRPAGDHAENALRDARGALWRAEIAARQAGERGS